jgi:signal transduction histidine kinase
VTIRNPVRDALKPDGDRIFERYYRHELADRRGGQGLGLHLSRRIAQLLGGELTYHYQNGQAHFDLRIGGSAC